MSITQIDFAMNEFVSVCLSLDTKTVDTVLFISRTADPLSLKSMKYV